MGWFGPKTPDDQLAADVRAAAREFNRAIEKAHSAGLNIAFYTISSWGGSKDYQIDRTIEIRDIVRENRERF